MRRLKLACLGASMAMILCGSPSRSEPPEPPAKRVLDGRFPLSAEESGAALRAEPGFRAEVFAAEPHLASPVGMAFDADGDVFVAEMLDYPIIRTPGMFGPFPEGQIRLLRTDERGKVVRSTVFAGALNAPTSVVPHDGGVLVAAAPDILFLKDTDGDGHADVREVVLTGFDASQDLYRLNSLLWGVDGWIYARGVGNTPIRWGDDPEGPAALDRGDGFPVPASRKEAGARHGHVELLRADDGRLGASLLLQLGQPRLSGRLAEPLPAQEPVPVRRRRRSARSPTTAASRR